MTNLQIIMKAIDKVLCAWLITDLANLKYSGCIDGE